MFNDVPVIHEVAGAGTFIIINLSPLTVLDAAAGHNLSAVVNVSGEEVGSRVGSSGGEEVGSSSTREVQMAVGTEDDWDRFVWISGRRVPVEVQDPLCAAGELHRLPAQGRL